MLGLVGMRPMVGTRPMESTECMESFMLQGVRSGTLTFSRPGTVFSSRPSI